MELLGNLTSIQNFFTSSVDQPPLQELDVDISAAEMGNKRSQLKEKDKETGNKPGVLDIVEPLCMEVPAEDTETTSLGDQSQNLKRVQSQNDAQWLLGKVPP